jgi:hypothetical protein
MTTTAMKPRALQVPAGHCPEDTALRSCENAVRGNEMPRGHAGSTGEFPRSPARWRIRRLALGARVDRA